MLRAALNHETLAQHATEDQLSSRSHTPFGVPHISFTASNHSSPKSHSPAFFPSTTPDESHQSISPASVIISGGSGANFLVDAFLALSSTCAFVLPISDNGGSSSELIRVIGGPSVGDLRSRLIRLIPNAPRGSPSERIKNLLSHRLSSTATSQQVKQDWLSIVEGISPLWIGIPADRRETSVLF